MKLRVDLRQRVLSSSLLYKKITSNHFMVTGEWRRQHNGDLNDPYSSSNIIRVIKSRIIRWAGHVASMGDRISACRLLVGIPEGRTPLERPRRRWEGNIK
jgi:hypothetical protein